MHNTLYRLFAPPRFLIMPAAGIEISDAFVRALSFSGSLGTMRVSWWQEEALPRGAIVGGTISDKSAVVEVLKKIRIAHGFNFAHISIPEQKSYLCELEAPVASPEEARLTIEPHLEEQVPIRASEAVFDAVLDKQSPALAGSTNRMYRVAAAQKKIVESYAEVCVTAGIAPLSFDIEAGAITRAIIGARDSRSLLVVNLSEDDTGLYVFSDGAVRFASTVPLVAGESVPEEIFRALAGEVTRVREFWETHGEAGKKIQGVVACGRGAAFPHTLSTLSSTLHLPVEAATVWQNAFSVERAVPPMSRDESLRFAAPIGLALRYFSYI
ncbi:MAG: Type IV pilus assembly protein PilM [Parcubacteria group bacterium Gr01-1014_17]|nr:MAG: Type IV pilus assembly protein PilM [Parcubacteria group bacterium Gr01-1014_17]